MTLFRWLFTGLLLLHGLIHVVGIAKGWVTPVATLTGSPFLTTLGTARKSLDAFWVLACALFLTAAAASIVGVFRWWWLVWAGILVSQFLIVLYWPQAKAGTIVNGILLLMSFVLRANDTFSNRVHQEIEQLYRQVTLSTMGTHFSDKHQQPLPVQKWLDRAHVRNGGQVQTVFLRQSGKMRTQPNGSWMPVQAEQYFTITEPAFIWNARIRIMPGAYLYGRDRYAAGGGNMLIKALAVWPVADARGPEIDQGSMLRYLAETVWFPSAALQDYMVWEPLTETTARATLRNGGRSVTGVFTFNSKGDVINVTAQRYREFKGTYRLETWSVALSNHQERNGLRIPLHAEVTWKLAAGDFTWYELDITEIAYNKSFL